ncbi:hypothetical protein K7G98_03830 [Saccharothrix sp. MB29]|nr:hypothetical protein [Saccharothrix sp. MB29]
MDVAEYPGARRQVRVDNRWGAFPVALCAAVAYAVVGGRRRPALRAATRSPRRPPWGALLPWSPRPVRRPDDRRPDDRAPSSAPTPVPPGFRAISAPVA